MLRTRELKLTSEVPSALLNALRLEPGIERVDPTGKYTFNVCYRLAEVTLSGLVRWLAERGSTIDATLFERIKLGLLAHMDSVESEAVRSDANWDAQLRRLYIGRQRTRHGRRDERARHWRKYLAREDARP